MDKKDNENEIIGSVNGVLKSRLFTNVYGTFAISWAIFHWEFIYTLISVNEQLIFDATGLLKHTYLLHTFFDVTRWYFWWSWMAPFFTTWFIIWELPNRVLFPAFIEEDTFRSKKMKIRLENDRLILESETKFIKEEEKQLIAKEKKVATQKKVEETSPEVLWEKEYQEFKKSPQYSSLFLIIKSIYEERGAISRNGIPIVGKDLLAYAHSHDLVEIEDDNLARTISLTLKGKYFVAQYTQENK